MFGDDEIPEQVIIDGWVTEPYMKITMYQNDTYRCIIDRLEKFDDKEQIICQTYVIGLLKPLNNKLLDVYTVEEYLEGIDGLCQFYNTYQQTPKDQLVVKKGWMKEKHRKRFFQNTDEITDVVRMKS